MNVADWIALTTPGLAVTGGVLAAVVKLDRLTSAVERLETSMGKIVGKVEDHEVRLAKGGL